MGPNKHSVLVVDDDRDILWTFGRHLLKSGFAVATCADGAEAMVTMESRDFDVMITDLRMPQVDGLELIDWARKNRKEMRVILITGFGSETVRDISETKSVVYLEKPVDLEDLVDTITELLAPPEEDGPAGGVAEIDLLEYLQLLVICERKAVLEAQTEAGRNFKLYVDSGTVVHASAMDGLSGEEAFFQCVLDPARTFSMHPWTDPPDSSISRSGAIMLKEAVSRRNLSSSL